MLGRQQHESGESNGKLDTCNDKNGVNQHHAASLGESSAGLDAGVMAAARPTTRIVPSRAISTIASGKPADFAASNARRTSRWEKRLA
jgi:hypothetical protein